MEGLYTYCVLGEINENIETLLNEGMDPALPVYVIKYEKIGVAVSKVSLAEFGQEALHENIQNNMGWVEDKARRHSYIIEVLSDSYNVIPFSFCTIYKNEQNIFKMLSDHYLELCESLEKNKDKSEWTLRLFYNIEEFNDTVVEEMKRELDSKIISKPPGTAYLLKKKFDTLVKEEADNYLNEKIDSIYQELSEYFTEDITNGNNYTESPDKNTKLLQKWSLLIAKNNTNHFLGKVSEINQLKKNEGIFLDISGPWPPYSFSNLNFNKQ